MQGGDDLSIEELASTLSTYKDQLREVRLRFVSTSFLEIIVLGPQNWCFCCYLIRSMASVVLGFLCYDAVVSHLTRQGSSNAIVLQVFRCSRSVSRVAWFCNLYKRKDLGVLDLKKKISCCWLNILYFATKIFLFLFFVGISNQIPFACII